LGFIQEMLHYLHILIGEKELTLYPSVHICMVFGRVVNMETIFWVTFGYQIHIENTKRACFKALQGRNQLTWHAIGRRFDPDTLHSFNINETLTS